MKIYNKLIVNMSTGETVHEDSFEYTGPVSNCKSGGGGGGTTTSSTVTGDPVYNAGMLALAEEQQDWAREMYDVFKTGTGADDTSELQYLQNVINANQSVLATQTEATKLGLEDSMTGLRERAPVRTKFFEEAERGVDVGERMGLAQADVAQEFAGAEGMAGRSAARMGRSAESIDFSGIATERAKAIGTARTKARVGAGLESFARLESAMR